VAWRSRCLLLLGPSGAGKSSLALGLMARGWMLVADDQVHLEAREGLLWASALPAGQGLIEDRGIGLLAVPWRRTAPIALVADLGAVPARLPDPARQTLLGVDLPSIAFDARRSDAVQHMERAFQSHALALPEQHHA
jgi:serine kinase of HPr protein (carbohydrate metabolism regulator)